ncbi:helix-turn-helix domain-containing protein [Pantoea sp. Cy-640]|uniref:helix-turn-helix domain-containing protein n=1 Tax=Pantoea sp. Cy-640 TaxID=2608353 RepID=UPI001FFCFE44
MPPQGGFLCLFTLTFVAIAAIVDLSELAVSQNGVVRIVLESIQDMLLKVALQTARDDYETSRQRQRQGVELAKASGKYKGRRPEPKTHERIIALRESGMAIARIATLAGCSVSQVKRIWSIYKADKSVSN